jgi:3-deoxy-D-manno-octulosonate 8-phosphate phosphatase (KDO 8-P phosphatase)
MLTSIRLLVLDVDGVLTDGGIRIDDRGVETKRFSVRDGFAIAAARHAGIAVAVATGRSSPLVNLRMAELGVEPVLQGVRDKRAAVERIGGIVGVEPAGTACMGDDLVDLPALGYAGVAICPADAVAEVRERADLVTEACGGHGAVREAIEKIMKAQGTWDAVVERYGGEVRE